MASQILDTDRNEINAPVGRMAWLRADTIVPWAHQRDLNKAAVNKIARDFDPDTLGTLTVTRRDGINYLLDGQHRLAAIKDVLGWADQNVPCVVYEGLTDAQEAKLFNAQAPGKRRQLPPLHAMYVDYQAGVERVVKIVGVVERCGLRMGWKNNSNSPGTVVAATAIMDAFDKYGPWRLQQVLEVLRDGLGPAPGAYTSDNLRGVMAFWLRYAAQVDRRELVSRLRASGIDGVRRETANMKAALGGGPAESVGRAIHKIYNHNRRTLRLPEWQNGFVAPDVHQDRVARMAQTQAQNVAIGALVMPNTRKRTDDLAAD